MARLPIVNSDDGTWGGILNEFLEVEHNSDGTLKNSGTLGAYAPLANPTFTGTVTLPAPVNPTDAVTKQYVDAIDNNNVKLTGNQTVGGEKTFTSQITGDYGANGKVSFSGVPSDGGAIGLYKDASNDFDKPGMALSASSGILFGSGSDNPDTVISRAGAGNLSFNSARLSNVADPTVAQDAATKKYVDDTVTTPIQLDPDWETGSKFRFSNSEMDTWLNTARTSSNPVNVVVIGDSLTIFNSARSYPYELERRIASITKKPSVSVGWRFAKGTLLSPNMSSFEGVNNATDTLGGYGGILTAGQKGTLTGSSDGVSVVYRTQLTGGNLIVRDGVGGTALTTINTAGTAGLHIWTSGALTDASRTIEIEASGGSVIVDGLYLHQYNRTSGVRVWNCGRSGSRTQDYIDNAALGMDLINYFQSEGTLGAVLIGTGTNDTDSSGDGGASQLQEFYGDVRDASTTVPIFVWIPYINQVFTASEHAQRLAAAKGLTDLIIDGNALIPDFVGNPTWDAGDAVHLTSSAGLIIGQNIALAMSGDPFGQLQRQLRGAFLPLSGGTLTGDLTAVNVNATGSIAIQETGTPKSSLHFIGAFVGALFGLGGATVRFGDSANDPDTNITRIGSGRLALNKSEGTLAANLSPYINAQTGTSYTLALTDAGKQITRNNSSASTQTFPQNSDAAIPVGTQIRIHNIGSGTVTLQAGTGATLVGDTSLVTNKTAFITKISTNGWLVNAGGSVAGATMNSDSSLAGNGYFLDEDNMASDSATKVPSQQSVKAYVDASKIVALQQGTGAAAFDTTTAETSVLSGGAITVPAGTLATNGDQIVVTYVGDVLNNTGAAVKQTNRLKVGSNTLVGLNGYSLATNAFVPPCKIHATVTRVSATSVVAEMHTILNNALNTNVIQAPITSASYTVSDLSSNTLNLDLTWQMNTSNASARITPKIVVIKVERV